MRTKGSKIFDFGIFKLPCINVTKYFCKRIEFFQNTARASFTQFVGIIVYFVPYK